MKLIEPSYQIEQAPPYHDMLTTIERAARTCYQSWDRIKDGSAEKLIRHCINRGHKSVLEHCSISVRITCDRGVSHEFVRHRLASYSQESQRYCAYKDDIEFILPHWWKNKRDVPLQEMWKKTMRYIERAYHLFLSDKYCGCDTLPPQDARAVLPNATNAEVVSSRLIASTNKIKGLQRKFCEPFFWVIRVGHKKKNKTILGTGYASHKKRALREKSRCPFFVCAHDLCTRVVARFFRSHPVQLRV